MPAVTHKGLKCSGHDSYKPRPSTQGSDDVFINGQPAHRVGDEWEKHGHEKNPETLAEGSATVFVNGKPLGRIGDQLSCPSVVAEGSDNVFNEDAPPRIEIVSGKFMYTPEFSYTYQNAKPVVKSAGLNAVIDEPEYEEELTTLIDNGYPQDTIPDGEMKEIIADDPPQVIIDSECPVVDESNIDYDLQLSPNYKLRDLTIDCVFPHKLQAQNGYTVTQLVCNLKFLCINVLEPLRAQYPGFNINSGFRTRRNGKSQHEKGQAIDVQWPGKSGSFYTPVGKWVAENINYDQFIFEHGNSIWLHISFDRDKSTQRQQTLTYYPKASPQYKPGLTNHYA